MIANAAAWGLDTWTASSRWLSRWEDWGWRRRRRRRHPRDRRSRRERGAELRLPGARSVRRAGPTPTNLGGGEPSRTVGGAWTPERRLVSSRR